MKLTYEGQKIGNILTNRSLTLDEAIEIYELLKMEY